MCVVGQPDLLAAGCSEIQSDRLRLALIDDLAKFLADLVARRHQQPVMVVETLFVIAHDRNSLNSISLIDKDKEIPTADDRDRRRDVRRNGIGVKLFVDDDPHLDAVPFHHREQQRAEALHQPFFANIHLRPLRQQLWHRWDRLVRAILTKKYRHGEQADRGGQYKFSYQHR